jgi:hypothetical protein
MPKVTLAQTVGYALVVLFGAAFLKVIVNAILYAVMYGAAMVFVFALIALVIVSIWRKLFKKGN